METKTKLVLTRKSAFIDRIRNYKVFIDGEKKGTIANDSIEEFMVEPGTHTVSCKLDWCGSRDYTIDVQEGEVAYLEVKNAMRYHWFLVIPAIIAYFVYFYGYEQGERPRYLLYAALLLFFVSVTYNLYYTVISRKDYLVLEKDTTTLFGK